MKVVILFLIITNSIFARQWVSSDGKAITGELLDFDSVTNQVTLERSDGKIFTFNTNRLCSDDIAYIHDFARGHEPAPSDVLMKAIEWMEESNDKRS